MIGAYGTFQPDTWTGINFTRAVDIGSIGVWYIATSKLSICLLKIFI